MYLNIYEEKIITNFLKNIDDYESKVMKLIWQDGSSIAVTFDTCFEGENDLELDDEKYEEFWSFVFKVVEVIGELPVYITEDEYFCINYRNFPDEIIVGDKKIN